VCYYIILEADKDNGTCKLWRISFSAPDKKIIMHADGTLKATEEKTCRKDVLRLLKSDIELFKNEHIVGDKDVLCSLHVKTILLRCLDDFRSDKDWTEVRDRYVGALHRFVACLESRVLPHYYVNSVNIIDGSRLSSAQWNKVVNFFKDIIDEFAVTSASLELVPA
jgi:Mab-21 protein